MAAAMQGLTQLQELVQGGCRTPVVMQAAVPFLLVLLSVCHFIILQAATSHHLTMM